MKKTIILGTLIAFLLVLSGCNSSKSDFVMRYSYGVSEKNIFDTEKNLYTKDMVCDPSEDYKVTLTEEEKKTIQDTAIKSNFFDLKSDMRQGMMCLPSSSMTLNITIGEKTNTIKWRCGFPSDDPDYKKLKEIETTILGIISQKEKELNIPSAKCGYE